ncbi:MAG: HlyD family secretion protein [Anaerolineae bacterium]
MKKWLVALLVVIVMAGAGVLATGGLPVGASLQKAEPEATPLPPAKAPDVIVAEARVVPVQSVALSSVAGGTVMDLLVAEGDVVTAGQALLRLDSAKARVALAEAQANLDASQARLDKLMADVPAEDIAKAEVVVEVARINVQSAESAITAARANLSRAQAGATSEDIAIGERRVEQAKNALWSAQAQRDSVCGRVGSGGQRSDCDAAQAQVQKAEEEVGIAELQLQQLRNGAQPEDITTASAGVKQAESALSLAQAQVRSAELDLQTMQKDARLEDIAVARAQVAQAQAAVDRAQLALDETEVRACIPGTVVALSAKVGEQMAPGAVVAQIGDLSTWQIETNDLNELSVVKIQQGDAASVRFDALPELELPATVTRINALGEARQGDMTYTVLLTLVESDARLRWNMTASVSIDPQ